MSQEPTRKSNFLTHIAAAILLALFVCAIFYRLLFTNQVLASGDILYYFYPYRDYAMQALREGRIPLWNPYSFLGVPFLANPQAAVLYPLHWPLSWLSVTKHIYWSAALHAWILGMGGYALMRQWRVGFWAGCTTAFVLAGSGFYGGMIGHINQMNGAAWLPWALLILVRVPMDPPPQPTLWWAQIVSRRSLPAVSLFGLCVALMLLAGHTQTTYINLFGIGAWIVLAAAFDWQWRGLFRKLYVYAGGCFLGVLISAAQLLPTVELSNLGLRSGGLSFGEASSFSLDPRMLFWTLLPSYGLRDLGVIFETLGYSEFVAYVGAIGLLLALVGALRGDRHTRIAAIIFVGLGLALALGRWNPIYALLYKFVPGFDLFRTPARWMMLYTMGMAILAGVGLQTLGKKWRFLALILPLLIGIDLVLAARSLPHVDTTAPQAVYDVRTAPAFLQSDPQWALHPAAAGRFLSMSTTTFDPGDMNDYRRILRESDPPQITERAFMQLLVAQKSQEILAPNLPLFWRVPAVDGFDGGVLPLQRYIKALEFFVPADRLVPDGRLREQVREMPSANLLGLLNVRYIITDKIHDFWFENIYYDRKIGAVLNAEFPTLTIVPPLPFEATHLMLISALAEKKPDGEKANGEKAVDLIGPNLDAALVNIASAGRVHEVIIAAGSGAGAQLADQTLESAMAAASGATVAYQNIEDGLQEYLVPIRFDAPLTPTKIEITLLDAPGVLIRAATLYDERTKMFQPLTVSDRGHFEVVHGGDVKLYENMDLLPRAYLVHDVVSVESAEEAFTLVDSDEINFRETAVVESGASTIALRASSAPDSIAEIVSYSAEEIVVQTSSSEDALLVVSDTIYPGWRATVNGQDTPIHATNYLFRGVQLPAGDHTVVMRYQPTSWRIGVWISAFGLVAMVALAVAGRGKSFK